MVTMGGTAIARSRRRCTAPGGNMPGSRGWSWRSWNICRMWSWIFDMRPSILVQNHSSGRRRLFCRCSADCFFHLAFSNRCWIFITYFTLRHINPGVDSHQNLSCSSITFWLKQHRFSPNKVRIIPHMLNNSHHCCFFCQILTTVILVRVAQF